jgi:outer membrane immunogenic protein
MYRIGLLAFTLTSVAALTAANAADMYRAPEPTGFGGYKDAYVPIWPGLYGGVNGGGGWGGTGNLTSSCTPAEPPPPVAGVVKALIIETCNEADDPKLKSSGGFFGGQIGYNWQRDRFVYGLEGDLQGSWIGGKSSISIPDGDGPIVTNASSNLDWFGTIRGRLGYAVLDNTLLYATGGFAFGGVRDKLSVSEVGSGESIGSDKSSKTATGYAVGGGVEYAFSPRFSAKIEYQYIDLGSTALSVSKTEDGDAINSSIKIDHTYNTVRVGLNYHVLPSYEPLK